MVYSKHYKILAAISSGGDGDNKFILRIDVKIADENNETLVEHRFEIEVHE